MESRVQTEPTHNELRASQKLVGELKTVIQRAEQKAIEQAKAADRVVRGHPYQTMGLAFGLGLLVGILARRKW